MTLKTKGEAYRNAWKCPACRLSQKGGKQKCGEDMSVLLANINRKLDDLLTLKETVVGIETSVQLMSDQYDSILSHMKEQDRELKDLKKRVEAIEQSEKEAKLKQLQLQVNDLEWRSRKLNLEFHGIPKTEGEDLISKVNNIAEKLEMPELSQSDVTAIHRLPSKPDKIPGIIIKFASQTTRDAWLDRRARLRNAGINAYVSENMTTYNRELLAKTKEWAKGKGFLYVWHRNGKLFVRRKDGERSYIVKNEDDLRALDS